MSTVYVVYKTDSHHSYASRDIIVVATSPKMAISICKQQAKKEHHKINEEQLFNLNNIKQTQGYTDGEFQFEEMNTNTLL